MKTPRLLLSTILLSTAATLSAQTPVISGFFDSAGVTANAAQGSVFIVKGTGLCPAGVVQANAPAYPTILNNVRVTLTPAAGGTALNLLMVYTFNDGAVTQLAGVAQSTTPLGAYDVRVINGAATSAAFRTNIVARKPGIVTSDGSGVGIAQATLEGKLILQRNSVLGKIGDFDTRPAHAGDRMDLWGVGLGADVASDTGGTSGDQTAAGQIRVVLNGVDIVPLYAGRSQGYPGLDQTVFIIPSDVALKCNNTLQIRAGGVLSNQVTIATSAASDTACPTTPGGNPGGNPGGVTSACPARTNTSTSNVPTLAEYTEWANSGQLCSGGFSIHRNVNYGLDTSNPLNPNPATVITREDTAGASFSKITGSDLTRYINNTSALPGFQIPAPGVCNIFTTQITDPFPNLVYQGLDAGTPLTVTGPNGAKSVPRSANSVGVSYGAKTGLGIPGNWMDSGNYTFAGPGSSTVGSFTGTLTVPPEFVVTNASALATVNRASGLTVNWTGGDPRTLVFITGSSFTASSDGTPTGLVTFQCYENNTAGRYSVPLSVLQRLPASSSFSAGGFSIVFRGVLGVSSISEQVRVPVAGIDIFTLTSSYDYAFTTQFQ